MIRINLVGVERRHAKTTPLVDPAARVTLGCSLVLVAAVVGIGWWYWSLGVAASRLDADVRAAEREQTRLRTVIAEVQRFEQRRAQLEERVGLIGRLRGGQSLPVQLLDHVSRSLPEMLWLSAFEQEGPVVTIEGRSTTLIGLSDFVRNLGSSALLQKPIEIVDSQVVVEKAANGEPEIEVIRFTVKAQIATASQPRDEQAAGGTRAKPRRGARTAPGTGA